MVVKSFNESIKYSFNYEGLPLDSLKLNDMKINETLVEICTPKNTWLDCLATKERVLELKRCESSYPLKISYDYDNKENYANIESVSQKIFEHKVNLKCKF